MSKRCAGWSFVLWVSITNEWYSNCKKLILKIVSIETPMQHPTCGFQIKFLFESLYSCVNNDVNKTVMNDCHIYVCILWNCKKEARKKGWNCLICSILADWAMRPQLLELVIFSGSINATLGWVVQRWVQCYHGLSKNYRSNCFSKEKTMDLIKYCSDFPVKNLLIYNLQIKFITIRFETKPRLNI